MIGAALEDDRTPRLSHDAGDDAERSIEPCEYRPLLDVELDERRRKLVEPAAAQWPRLLGTKDDDAERSLAQALGGLDRGDDAERTVETACGRHRVEVRPAPDGCRAAPSVQVACSVHVRLEPRCLHPGSGELVRRVLLPRVPGTVLRDRRDLLEPVGSPHQRVNARSTRQPASGNSATTA